MAKKQQSASRPTTEQLEPETTTTAAARPPKLVLPLTEAGTIDWEHLRTSTQVKLFDVLERDDRVRSRFTQSEEAEADLFEGITQENVARALDLIQSANALVFRIVAAKWIKHPILRDARGKPAPLILDEKLLNEAFSFTPKQHAELDPRAHRIAQKYSGKLPDWLKQNLDLYMFGSMFLSYTAQNAKAAITRQVQLDYLRAVQRGTQPAPVQPQPDSDARQPVNGKERQPSEAVFDENILSDLADETGESPTT